jgi:hypothetical protein
MSSDSSCPDTGRDEYYYEHSGQGIDEYDRSEADGYNDPNAESSSDIGEDWNSDYGQDDKC